MASAAITIVESPCTIESDTSEALISKGARLKSMVGKLINHGPEDVWCKVSVVRGTAAATVVTTGTQAQLQVPLPAGGALDILKHYDSIAHKTAGGAAVLSWQPSPRDE